MESCAVRGEKGEECDRTGYDMSPALFVSFSVSAKDMEEMERRVRGVRDEIDFFENSVKLEGKSDRSSDSILYLSFPFAFINSQQVCVYCRFINLLSFPALVSAVQRERREQEGRIACENVGS